MEGPILKRSIVEDHSSCKYVHSEIWTHINICKQKVHCASVSRQQILEQLAEIYLWVPGAVMYGEGNVTSCSSALWEVEFLVGLGCRSDQSLPDILSKASRLRQMATCSLLSSVLEERNKVV